MYSRFYDPRHNSFSVEADTTYKELNRPILSAVPSLAESVVTEEEDGIKYMTAAMCASVIENSITALNVLGNCNNGLRLKKMLLNKNALLVKKYGIKPSSTPVDPIRYPIDCDENKIEKLTADRELIMNVFIKIYTELTASRTFQHLQDVLQKNIDKEDNLFAKEEAENKSQYRELKKRLRSQRNVQRLALFETEDRINRLVDLLGDTELLSTIKHKYLGDWKHAQVEQQQKKIEDVQSAAINNIRRGKVQTDKEIRAHYEIEKFQNVLVSELMEDIEAIMTKYDVGIEEMSLKIQVSMSQLAEMKGKRLEMEDKLKKRSQEMDSWIKYKEERSAEQARVNRYNNAAIIVQAWWRGLLVRQRLGPFRGGGKQKRGKKKRASQEVNDEVE